MGKLSTLLPNEEKNESQITNSTQAIFQGIGAISSLKMLFVYVAEIEHELSNKQENSIVKDTYCQYKKKVMILICDTANIFKSATEYICTNAIINVSEITDAKMTLEDVVDQMCDAIFDVAKESSYEDKANFFEEFTTQFCEYADASGIIISDYDILG